MKAERRYGLPSTSRQSSSEEKKAGLTSGEKDSGHEAMASKRIDQGDRS